jgi:sulfur relay (sulfurtransferase) complex TusBCD TusD component (DsrE family)
MNDSYFLIASRDPYTHASARQCYELAARLAGEGHRVTLFLVQNGVLPARHGACSAVLAAAAHAGVRVLADEFSLAERGIDARDLSARIAPAPLDAVIDALAEGARAIWH